ncbi:MAG: membrane protein [Phycisphaeraceae bacterium]|nr:MAG: membrane protein [Phycisphaeraceae bacterium]
MTGTLWLAIAFGSVVLGSILSAIVFALADASRARLDELVEDRPDAVRARVKAILDDMPGHGAVVGLPRTLANLGAALATVMWVAGLSGHVSPTPMDILIGLAAGGVVIWALSFALPMSIAEHAAERVVVAGSVPTRALYILMFPVRGLFHAQGEVVRRLAGPEDRTPDEQLEHELRDVVEEHAGEDFDEAERDMLEAVVEFRSTTVSEIMTPRTEVQALAYTDDLGEVKKLIDERGHSRVPVYEDSLDRVIGMLYAKDLLRWIINHGGNGKPFVLREVIRDAVFVPETKTVRQLLTELLAARVHIAVVADEYGGTAGLVTIEDIVEEVFGEIADEYDEPEDDEPSAALDEDARTAELDARLHIDDANDALEPVGLELPESDDYDTVGGFVVTTLGRIPTAGDAMDHEGIRLSVIRAEPTRVVRVRLEHLSPEDAAEPDPDAEGVAADKSA